MLKTININTDLETIFKQYLTIINVVLSKDIKLTNIELDVLSKMLYVDHLYKHLDKDKRDAIIFHKETKLRIMAALNNISYDSYKNVLVSLKKKRFIDKNKLRVTPPVIDGGLSIHFKLNIADESTVLS